MNKTKIIILDKEVSISEAKEVYLELKEIFEKPVVKYYPSWPYYYPNSQYSLNLTNKPI